MGSEKKFVWAKALGKVVLGAIGAAASGAVGLPAFVPVWLGKILGMTVGGIVVEAVDWVQHKWFKDE